LFWNGSGTKKILERKLENNSNDIPFYFYFFIFHLLWHKLLSQTTIWKMEIKKNTQILIITIYKKIVKQMQSNDNLQNQIA
jgi:hypothetical protein